MDPRSECGPSVREADVVVPVMLVLAGIVGYGFYCRFVELQTPPPRTYLSAPAQSATPTDGFDVSPGGGRRLLRPDSPSVAI